MKSKRQAALDRADDVFEDHATALQWLNSTIPALNGQIPMHLIDTEEGAQIVLDLLGRIEHGVYS